MPELPEVVTIKRDLERQIIGKKIIAVEVNRPEPIKEPSPDEFVDKIKNEKIKKIIRRGKLLVFALKKDKFLIIHLRINGWLRYGQKEPKARVVFSFAGNRFLNYMDSRLLGQLSLRSSFEDLSFVKKLGPEISDITAGQFQSMLGKRKAKIKALLMDQHFLAGLGNIYAQEALFLAGIDPRRPANSLQKQEARLLYGKIKNVLQEAIQHRGSSVDAYRDTAGKKGGMEKRLNVYQKKQSFCPRCHCRLEMIKVAARGTCFCPRCQK